MEKTQITVSAINIVIKSVLILPQSQCDALNDMNVESVSSIEKVGHCFLEFWGIIFGRPHILPLWTGFLAYFHALFHVWCSLLQLLQLSVFALRIQIAQLFHTWWNITPITFSAFPLKQILCLGRKVKECFGSIKDCIHQWLRHSVMLEDKKSHGAKSIHHLIGNCFLLFQGSIGKGSKINDRNRTLRHAVVSGTVCEGYRKQRSDSFPSPSPIAAQSWQNHPSPPLTLPHL